MEKLENEKTKAINHPAINLAVGTSQVEPFIYLAFWKGTFTGAYFYLIDVLGIENLLKMLKLESDL